MRFALIVLFFLVTGMGFSIEPVLGEYSHLISGEISYALPSSGSGYITDIRLFWKSLIFLEDETAVRRADRTYLLLKLDEDHFIEVEKERKDYLVTIEDDSRHFSALARISKNHGGITVLKGPDYIGRENGEDPDVTALEIKKYIEELQDAPDFVFFMAESMDVFDGGTGMVQKESFSDYRGITIAQEVFDFLNSDEFRYIDNDYYYRPKEIEANKFYDGDDFVLYMWFSMIRSDLQPRVFEIQRSGESIYRNNLVVCVYPVPGGWMWAYSRKLGRVVYPHVKDIPAAIIGEDIYYREIDPQKHWIMGESTADLQWMMSRFDQPVGMQ